MRQQSGRVVLGWLMVALSVVGLAIAFLGLSLGLPGGRTAIAAFDRLLLAPRTVQPTHRVRAGSNVPTVKLPTGMVLGYFYAPGNPPDAVAMLRKYAKVLTGVIPFWYTINGQGQISGTTQASVLRWTQKHHLWTFGLVRSAHNHSAYLDQVLQSPVASQRAISEMLTLVESNRLNGINLDWEGIKPSYRHRFTGFVQQLARVFHAHGYLVTLSVPAETRNNPQNSWSGAYDYAALGKAANLMMIMAYDQHSSNGPPGPIASRAWVRQVLTYTISAIAPQKVILGIPGYGYNWGGPSATALSYPQARLLEKKYAPSARGNHFNYVQNGVVHSVWFENAQSFLPKIQLVAGYELRGIALWRLGIEDPRIWNFLQ